MYLDKGGNVVKGSSKNAHLAVDVQSSGPGLETVRPRYGTMPRTPLLKPAIEPAEKGFVLDRGDVGMLATTTADFRNDRDSGAIFVAKTSRSSSAGSSCRRNSPERCVP